MGIQAVLFDLDGVIRHFDPTHVAEVEKSHGLAPGLLLATAFAPDLGPDLVCGRITRAEWTAEIGARVQNVPAANEWLADRGTVDSNAVALVDKLRANGFTVALLTNGSDTIATELADFDLDTRFDAVFNSADIGWAKPDGKVYRYVCAQLKVEPDEIVFVDDSTINADAARTHGMHSFHFAGVPALTLEMKNLGLL